MTELKLVPKPEGFELRDRRSDKTNSASEWTARDALYAASESMTDKADAITIVWRELRADGSYEICRRNAGSRGSTVDLTVTALGIEMGWVR